MLSKADRFDGEVVEGWYHPLTLKNLSELHLIYWISENKRGHFETNCEIDPSTLKHSFDNGTTWHTEDEIKEALEAKNKPRYKCDECGIETDGSDLLCESCKKEYDEQ